jgi:membrane protein
MNLLKQAKAHSNLGFATATSLVLAIPQSIFYCNNLYGALIIIVSYFLISYLCLNLKFGNDNRWGLLFVFCLPVYIIDMMFLDATGLSRMETYPLVISQIYTLPLFGILNGFICLTGYNLMNHSYNGITRQNNDPLSILIMRLISITVISGILIS